MKQNLQIKFFLLLALAMVGSSNVWGFRGARVFVKSQPTIGGYVYANTENSGSASSLTEDKAENYNLKTSTQTFSFWLFASAKTGYTFKGWNTSSSATSGVASSPYKVDLQGTNWKDYNEYTYYAIFKANTYTVTLNANGGTSSPTSISVTYDATYSNLPTPTWANHRFDGWFTAQNGGTQVTTSTQVTITANQTLYAHWTPIYSGTFYSYAKDNGQTWITVNGTEFNGNFTKANDNTSRSYTQNDAPTFPVVCYAKANAGYTFAGWYDNESCTGTPISTSTDTWCKLTDNVTATQLVTTKSYYAKFTPGVTYYATAYSEARPNVAGVGLTYISCKGNSPSSDANYTTSDKRDNSTNSVTTQSASGTIKADYYAKALAGYKFGGWYSDAACTQLVGAGDANDRNHYVENIVTTATSSPGLEVTRYAKFNAVTVSTATAQTKNFTASGTQTATLVFPVANASSNSDFNEPTISGDAGWTITGWNYNNNQVSVTVSYTATAGTTTLGNHNATVTVKAKSNNSNTGNVTASVSINPTFTCNIASEYLVDNASLNLSSLWTSNGNGTITYSITSFTPSGINNTGATAPAISGSTLSLGQAGTLVLQLSQAAGTTNNAGSATKTITINKRDNHIAINGTNDSYAQNIYMDGYATINLTATNTDYAGSPISNSQTAGNDIATFYQGDKVVYSTHNLGDATWSLSQPENYKYKAANASFTIHVVKQSEATDCYVLNAPDEKSYGKYGDCANKSYQDFNLSAPGKTLSFNMWKYSSTNDIGMKVYGYDANGSQVFLQEYSIGSLTTSAKNYSFNIASNVTRIRIQNGGGNYATASTLNCYASEVKVTRLTNLSAADVTIDKTSTNNPIHPAEIGVGSITINHSLANGGDLKVTWDNAKFTINDKTSAQGINLGDKGCSTGNTTLPISYTSQVAGEDVAHLVIYNNVYRATATITGTTVKFDQVITWADNIEYKTAGVDIENAATSTLGNVTYTSSNPEVISVVGNVLHTIKKGTATITAYSAGNAEYNEKYSDKLITVTDDKVQWIEWNQTLTNLKLGDSNKTLNASAHSDVTGCVSEGARTITYSSSDESVVKVVNTNQLRVVGVGTATVTATQAGGEDADGHTFIPTSTQKKAIVRDPSAACETYIYNQPEEWKKDMGWNSAYHHSHTQEIDFGGQEPGYYNVDYKGESHDVAVAYYNVNFYIDQYVNGSWVNVQDLGKPAEDQTLNTGNVNLDRKATKMRFRVDGYTGYTTFKDCQVTLARYLETANTLNKFEAKVGGVHEQTLTIRYSNVQGPLTITHSTSSSFALDVTEKATACGDYGTMNVKITYNPLAENDDEKDVLVISDGVSSINVNLSGVASITNRHIVWEQTPAPVYTIQTVTLTAEARTDLDAKAGEIFYAMDGTSTTGSVTGNTLSFTQDGTAKVIAQAVADPKYSAAAAVSKTWTVSKTPTTISTMPTAFGDIVSGTDIASLTLTGWQVTNTVNSEVVEGTLAITAGDLVNVGDKNLTLTFTPTNTNMFTGCTANMPVHVIQRAATDAEIGTIAASDITYGAAVKNSTLSNTGINGTWSWIDAKKDDVLDAGTYDNLQVHFVPQDANIAEKDATVSLTVNKAQPTITWTGESTYAWGKVDNLFSADNGATVTMTSLDETIAKIEDNQIVPVKAGTVVIRGAMAETTNYLSASLDRSITFNAPAENKFTNADGDNNWNNPNNWTSGVVPEKLNDVDVVINGEMVINEEIHVNSMTIESGASVKVIVNGDLSIHDASLTRDSYGDLFIKNGGAVELSSTSSKKMMVHNFVIESSIGTSNGTSASGQISNADALAFDADGDAYIDIHMDPSGKMDDQQWYGFTVPFQVDINTGIARQEGDLFRVIKDGVDFILYEYDATKRLNTGKGWKPFHSTLQPGVFYYLSVNGDNNLYSFRKKAGTDLVSANTMALTTNGIGANANWNAVGNPTMQQVKAEFTDKIVQVYVNGESRYQAVNTDDADFVVGCPFFIQASINENLTLTADNSHGAFYAPSREANVSDMFRVRFGQDAEHYSDQIFVSASEDALDQYEIGHDVAKVGVGTISAQLWVNAYSQKLCAHEAVLTNNNADFALTLYAPKAGEYTVSINREKMPHDATLYLTENGNIIWNLSASDYIVDLNKGNNTSYGLRLVQERRITTDTENVETKAQTNKMIINDNMYIFREGKIYDATGKLVK